MWYIHFTIISAIISKTDQKKTRKDRTKIGTNERFQDKKRILFALDMLKSWPGGWQPGALSAARTSQRTQLRQRGDKLFDRSAWTGRSLGWKCVCVHVLSKSQTSTGTRPPREGQQNTAGIFSLGPKFNWVNESWTLSERRDQQQKAPERSSDQDTRKPDFLCSVCNWPPHFYLKTFWYLGFTAITKGHERTYVQNIYMNVKGFNIAQCHYCLKLVAVSPPPYPQINMLKMQL